MVCNFLWNEENETGLVGGHVALGFSCIADVAFCADKPDSRAHPVALYRLGDSRSLVKQNNTQT